jgi:hypothetical protein
VCVRTTPLLITVINSVLSRFSFGHVSIQVTLNTSFSESSLSIIQAERIREMFLQRQNRSNASSIEDDDEVNLKWKIK